MTTVLAIDQGTSGTKAVVVAPDGVVLGLAEMPVRPTYSAVGAVEHDPRLILESVLVSGRAAIAQAGVDVDVVTLANQGETVLAWDPATGAPLTQMIVWQDRRAESVCRGLAEHRDEIAERTGLVLDPYFSAPKQAWIRENLTAEGVVTTSDAWLLHELTGEFVTDVSTASRSLVTGLDSTEWDAELLELFGPGTGAQRSSSGLAASVAWSVGGRPTYCLDGQVYTAASAIRWMENLGFIAHAADLDRVSEPESAGVFSVPALAGLGAPWWRPDARAALTGMSLSTGVGHIVRAVLEGIAAQVAELGELVARDIGQPLARLRVDGGLTRSRVLMQAVADLMQIEVDVYPSPHATPLGAAALARIAYAPGRALEDAVIAWTPAKVYTPRWPAERAADFRGTWRALAESTL